MGIWAVSIRDTLPDKNEETEQTEHEGDYNWTCCNIGN